ncbi:MAG: type IX secretion system sortase PorU, partial [Candidatus Eisenbacteria bacterium]|nr:type IX secretion system sortase PorU [Candidatus Eisenbacteria bacterium]
GLGYVYKRQTVANYEQAGGWRGPSIPRAGRAGGRNGADYYSTASGPWIDLSVDRTGLQAVSGTDLQAAGVDLGSIVPEQLRLFTGTGVELPETAPYNDLPPWLHETAIEIEGGEDGSFDPQDRILFYGLGPDGWFADYGLPDRKHERYHTDLYSNVNAYWLSWGGFEGEPMRWTVLDGTSLPGTVEEAALARLHFEKDLAHDYRPSEYQAGRWPFPDTFPQWERWFWKELIASASDLKTTVPFHVPRPLAGSPARMLLRFWGATPSFTERNHQIVVYLGDDSLAAGSWGDVSHFDLEIPGVALAQEDLDLRLLAPYRGKLDRSYLAWFELDYRRRLEAERDSLAFLVEPGSAARGFRVSGLSDPSATIVLDATDPLRPERITPSIAAGAVSFTVHPEANRERRMLVVGSARARTPAIHVDLPPEGGYLREREEPVDALVIAHGAFLDAARRLADFRKEQAEQAGDPLRIEVVDVQDVYDEFSAGRVDPAAIRNFLDFARDRWNGGDPGRSPSSVLLFGDASFDFRDRLARGLLFIPTYEGYYDPTLRRSAYSPQFASDDWFGLLDFDTQDDAVLDLAIGRLPADSPASAEAMVQKAIDYETAQAPGGWRQRFTLVADDVCQGIRPDGLSTLHMSQTEDLADQILPEEIERDRVFLYEYGKECLYDRKPAAAAALRASIDAGTLVVNYTGHGSEGQLADERVLETPGVAGMSNADRLFLFLTASCSVGKYDFIGDGLGETLVRHPGGGAIAVFSASAVAFSGSNALLNKEFFEAIWPGRDYLVDLPLGQAALVAKSTLVNPTQQLNSRRYPLLGDPLVRLSEPRNRVRLTIEALREDGSAAPDTILRGQKVRIAGEIVDASGSLQSGVDGEASFRVYDSEIVRKVSAFLEYNLSGATIFRGTAPVREGRFESVFLAPTALRLGDRGSAQAYASVVSGGQTVAIGGRTSGLAVPEIAPPAAADREGPRIEIVPPGDLAAIEAGSIWEAMLEDTSGINITQLIPTRSALLKIEDGSKLVHLQDLSAEVVFPEDYQRGEVSFRLPAELEAGRRYTMTIEASDNRDLRSLSSVEFTVVGGTAEAFALGRVYNVPNPMDRDTTFFLEITQPADATIRIFTNTGHLIRTIEASNVSIEQAGAFGIPWDGRDEDGDRIANGVYFYRVTVAGQDGTRESRTERLAVLR